VEENTRHSVTKHLPRRKMFARLSANKNQIRVYHNAKDFERHKLPVYYIWKKYTMTKEENIAKVHELAVKFTNSKDRAELKETVQELVSTANSFSYETTGAIYKILIPTFANHLLENISGIVDGSVDPSNDREVNDALLVFENIAESSVDS
jgi:hypothetical protein